MRVCVCVQQSSFTSTLKQDAKETDKTWLFAPLAGFCGASFIVVVHRVLLLALRVVSCVTQEDYNFNMLTHSAQVKDKINKHAFSGGQETLELQREKGADIEGEKTH